MVLDGLYISIHEHCDIMEEYQFTNTVTVQEWTCSDGKNKILLYVINIYHSHIIVIVVQISNGNEEPEERRMKTLTVNIIQLLIIYYTVNTILVKLYVYIGKTINIGKIYTILYIYFNIPKQCHAKYHVQYFLIPIYVVLACLILINKKHCPL